VVDAARRRGAASGHHGDDQERQAEAHGRHAARTGAPGFGQAAVGFGCSYLFSCCGSSALGSVDVLLVKHGRERDRYRFVVHKSHKKRYNNQRHGWVAYGWSEPWNLATPCHTYNRKVRQSSTGAHSRQGSRRWSRSSRWDSGSSGGAKPAT
jgi:hypothetical protein